jgi:hypothetical protein
MLSFSFNVSDDILESCDIREVYTGVDVDYDTKALTTYGDIEEIEVVLVEASIDVGLYEVEVTRKASNIYKVYGTDLYIETKYCHELSISDEATLKYESTYGMTKGELIFE